MSSSTSTSNIIKTLMKIFAADKKRDDKEDVFQDTNGVLMVEGSPQDVSFAGANAAFAVLARKPRETSQPIAIRRQPEVKAEKSRDEDVELPRENLETADEMVAEMVRYSRERNRKLSRRPFLLED